MRSWGAELGSDVPFFFSSGTAYCTGRGEKVESLVPLKPQTLWLIKPKEGLSTAKIFSIYQPECSSSHDPLHLLSIWKKGEKMVLNDLERPAFLLNPTLRQIKEELLNQGCQSVSMTGSGTAFFCFHPSQPYCSQEVAIKKVGFHTREKNGWY